jgi:hypothetical protein
LLAEGNIGDYFSVGFDMDFGWNFYERTKELYQNKISIKKFIDESNNEFSTIPSGKHRLYFTNNHDKAAWEKNDIQLYGNEKAALSAFTLTATYAGAPLIYSSQEVGFTQTLPFFSGIEFNYKSVDLNSNKKLQKEYEKITSIYNSLDGIRNGIRKIYNLNQDIICYSYTSNKEVILIAINIRDKKATLETPKELRGNYINLINNSEQVLPKKIDMEAYQYIIWKKK